MLILWSEEEEWSGNTFRQDKDVQQQPVPGVCGRMSSAPLLAAVLLKT